jgi:hypothetical protein
MNLATPAILKLARRLISLEAAQNPSNNSGNEAGRACEKLRTPLAKFAGVAGFRSLMGRALTLAKAELPWLNSVQIQADGSLEGFEAAQRDPGAAPDGEAEAVVLAQLLGLLVTFVGEPLTLCLVHDAWPDAPVEEINWGVEGQP